jgi:D-xylose 1-dehydrogenase (NADP+, D-xylono-1,5-lactone-forming)
MGFPMRWGLLSTARINRRLIPALRAAGRAELVAVASRDPERARAYAAEWQIPRSHGSYDALLADPQVDAVYISLPNSLHVEWVVQAARAGKHVLCEKPLATSVGGCDEIIAAAAAAGVVVAEASMHLYHPLMHKVRDLVQSGALGRVALVRGAFSFPLDRPNDVRWRPELGGGSLWDVGSYPVSFARWVAGEPEEVFGWQQPLPSGVDGTFTGLLRYQDGLIGAFDCGFCGQYRLQAEVVGSEAVLTVERPYAIDAESHIVLRRGFAEEKVTVPPSDPYQCEVEGLTAAALDGAPLPVSLSFSRANVATLVALYESARLGEPVRI